MADHRLTSVELFTGCGGLAFGMSLAGFRHLVLVERDLNAAETVAHNARRGVDHVRAWNYVRADIRSLNWSLQDWAYHAAADVVAGGPPCQPFGIGGKARGHEDERDMWPETIRAIHEIRPRAFAFENVSGLLRPRFSGYVDWVQASLAHPGMPRNRFETHADHLGKLRALSTPADYRVSVHVVNAADFGAPQIRKRVVVSGVRHDQPTLLRPLAPTHSRERLLWDQWVTGEYWARHGLPRDGRAPATGDLALVKRLRGSQFAPPTRAWVTVRDTLAELGEPDGVNNHVFQAGARSYVGHTGSPLDLPAKALKAGDHGVPGGENMLRGDDGAVRYFTLREAARLMGLPNSYAFPRSWSESMRQIGNAVPVQLGEALGRWLADLLQDRTSRRSAA